MADDKTNDMMFDCPACEGRGGFEKTYTHWREESDGTWDSNYQSGVNRIEETVSNWHTCNFCNGKGKIHQIQEKMRQQEGKARKRADNWELGGFIGLYFFGGLALLSGLYGGLSNGDRLLPCGLVILFTIAAILSLISASRIDVPLRDMEKAIRAGLYGPQTAAAYMILGTYYERDHINKAEAINCYSKAIQLHIDNPFCYCWRGELLFQQYQYKHARADFETALSFPPPNNLTSPTRERIQDLLKQTKQVNK